MFEGIKTIAHAELVARAELMVHLGQNVGEVDRVRIDSGGGTEPAEAYRVQAGVDRREVRRGNRDQAALIQLALFEVTKEERTIANDGAAHARAVLGLSGRQFAIRERIGRIQSLVTKVTV